MFGQPVLVPGSFSDDATKTMLDFLFVNGDVFTMDPSLPAGGSIAVKDGKIFGVGDPALFKSIISSRTKTIDLHGKAVFPGFIDSHLHFRALAESLSILSLRHQCGIGSIKDIINKICRETQDLPPGTWIRAGGYNETDLAEQRHPNRFDLDIAAPHHPVKLTHRSGHAHVLNSLGLQLVGIHRDTDDPPEGIIERDYKDGNPTGLLWGLNDFLSQKIPPVNKALLAKGVDLAEEKLLSSGITSFQDASPRNDHDRWQWYEDLKINNRVKPRITLMLGMAGFKSYRQAVFPDRVDQDDLSLKGIKLIVDETTGSIYPDMESLKEMVHLVHQSGFQVALHAIEPSAIHGAVEAISYALETIPRRDHRHRIEHCSVCPPTLIKKIATLGIGITTHPAFIFYSGDRYLKTVSTDQQPYLYPIASLLNAGIVVSAASDAPIAEVIPTVGIYSAITRLSETGQCVLAKERIPPERAIQIYTLNAAIAAFQENKKGTLSPGKLADFTVLSGNPLRMPENEIKDIHIMMTVIGGQPVWINKDF